MPDLHTHTFICKQNNYTFAFLAKDDPHLSTPEGLEG